MLANPDAHGMGTRFKVTVQVVRMVGQNFYVKDVKESEINGELVIGHIYVFSGYGTAYSSILELGSVITMECKLQYEGNYGTQLTDIRSVKFKR